MGKLPYQTHIYTLNRTTTYIFFCFPRLFLEFFIYRYYPPFCFFYLLLVCNSNFFPFLSRFSRIKYLSIVSALVLSHLLNFFSFFKTIIIFGSKIHFVFLRSDIFETNKKIIDEKRVYKKKKEKIGKIKK